MKSFSFAIPRFPRNSKNRLNTSLSLCKHKKKGSEAANRPFFRVSIANTYGAFVSLDIFMPVARSIY